MIGQPDYSKLSLIGKCYFIGSIFVVVLAGIHFIDSYISITARLTLLYNSSTCTINIFTLKTFELNTLPLNC